MKIHSLSKISVALALTALLGGCSAGGSVDAVSLTFDGFSYLTTGKSIKDHAVSVMAGKDCNMMRAAHGERTCVPHDEDVAGDRLVFEYAPSPWTEDAGARDADGDPLRVGPALAEMVVPLGDSVKVEARSSAVAAVAADPMPRLAPMASVAPAPAPDRATRLWLPAE